MLDYFLIFTISFIINYGIIHLVKERYSKSRISTIIYVFFPILLTILRFFFNSSNSYFTFIFCLFVGGILFFGILKSYFSKNIAVKFKSNTDKPNQDKSNYSDNQPIQNTVVRITNNAVKVSTPLYEVLKPEGEPIPQEEVIPNNYKTLLILWLISFCASIYNLFLCIYLSIEQYFHKVNENELILDVLTSLFLGTVLLLFIMAVIGKIINSIDRFSQAFLSSKKYLRYIIILGLGLACYFYYKKEVSLFEAEFMDSYRRHNFLIWGGIGLMIIVQSASIFLDFELFTTIQLKRLQNLKRMIIPLAFLFVIIYLILTIITHDFRNSGQSGIEPSPYPVMLCIFISYFEGKNYFQLKKLLKKHG